jgi:hypothetical protein
MSLLGKALLGVDLVRDAGIPGDVGDGDPVSTLAEVLPRLFRRRVRLKFCLRYPMSRIRAKRSGVITV